MMINENVPELNDYIAKMDVAEKNGNMDEYWQLDEEAGKLIMEQQKKEREEYLEIFGVDISKYSDYSYRLVFNIEEAKKKHIG